MKNHAFLLIFAAALVWSLAGCATSAVKRPATGHTLETTQPLALDLPALAGDDATPALAHQTVPVSVTGLVAREVLQVLGRPTERLTPDLWVYWRYYSPEQAEEVSGRDTLVVVFARGRVSTMKLVSGAELRAHLAGAWRPAPGLAQK